MLNLQHALSFVEMQRISQWILLIALGVTSLVNVCTKVNKIYM